MGNDKNNELNNETGKYYTIAYSFSNDSGELLGNSEMSGPFVFCIGAGDTIPGLEEHVVGKEQGVPVQFTIPAEKAYGVYNDDLVRIIPKTALSENIHLALGLQLHVNDEKVVIIEIGEDTVTVDSNHPLAGANLNFDVTILEISETRPVTSTGAESGGCGCNSCGCAE